MITLYDRPIFMLWLVKIWQVSSCNFDSWSWQSFLSTCDVFLSFSTGCIKWNTAAINSLLLFMAGLFIEFLVEICAACQSWKPDDFGWHRFRFSPCWMRVEKSLKRFWPYLIAFRSCISNGKPELLLYTVYVFVCFFISNFMKSSSVYEASLCSSSSLKTVNTRKPAKSFKLKLKDSGYLEML